MSRTSTLFCLTILGAAIISLANSSGAIASRTGAPGEQTCGSSSCHSAGANQENATVTLDFQNETTAYQAGETYRVTVSISSAQNANKNGFEIVALNADNENIGEWILAQAADTQIKNGSNRSYVTHTRDGNIKSSWEIDWKAPNDGDSDVSFYLAVLDANGNGGTSGDHLYTNNLTIPFNVTSSTDIATKNQIKVYPNPVSNILRLESGTERIKSYQLYNLSGQLLRSGFNEQELDMSTFLNGLYLLRLETNQGVLHQKIVVER